MKDQDREGFHRLLRTDFNVKLWLKFCLNATWVMTWRWSPCLAISRWKSYRVISLNWQKVLSFYSQTINFSMKYKKWWFSKFGDVFLYRKYSWLIWYRNPLTLHAFQASLKKNQEFLKKLVDPCLIFQHHFWMDWARELGLVWNWSLLHMEDINVNRVHSSSIRLKMAQEKRTGVN